MDEPHAKKLARVVLTGGKGKAPYRNSSMCGASHLKPDDALRSAGALGSNPTPANSRGAGNAAELGKWLV